MSNDERPDSLAAQAAAWVPPWERQPAPDRAYQAAADAEARAELAESADETRSTAAIDDLADDDAPGDDLAEAGAAGAEAATASAATEDSDDEDRSAAGLSDDDDDFDESFEGANPAGYGDEEQSAFPADDHEPLGVDVPAEAGAPAGDGHERVPSEAAVGPELPLPESIEQAAEPAEPGTPVDAPLPPDGDDAGDVFDAAADDDVSDDDEVDLPFTEEVPTEDDAAEGDAAEDDAAEDDAAEDDAAEDDAAEGDAAEDDAGAGSGEADDSAAGAEEVDGTWAAVASQDESGRADGSRDGAVGGVLADVGGAVSDGGDPAGGRRGKAVPGQSRRGRNGAVAGADATTRTANGVDVLDHAEAPAEFEDAELAAALEAILLVVDEPVAEMQLAQILEQPTERIGVMLEDISARYTAAGHGFDLRRAAGGWRLYTRPEYAAYVERFVLDGQSVRLTQAALETLAVVAYKQPVTRSRISAIRGVNCDGVMRTLVTRGLIEECGTEGETGAYLYRTTPLFLEKLGLNSVDQLPPLAPFLPDDVEEVLDAPG